MPPTPPKPLGSTALFSYSVAVATLRGDPRSAPRAESAPGWRVAHDRNRRRHRSEVSWDDDALTFGQRCILRLLINLGERPRWHMVSCRKSLPRITSTGRYRQAAVPQCDRSSGRKVDAQRHSFALGTRGCRSKPPDLANQLLMDTIHLLDVDMDDLAAV
jgi:hypothetical protein